MSYNNMTVKELYDLYIYISGQLEENNAIDYLVYEPGALELYEKMLNGEANRKDFLVFAIKDMLSYIKENNIENIKSTRIVKFNRLFKDN